MAFKINPLNQLLADGSGLTRLMKQKTCQFAFSLKVVVCVTLSHNVPDHSSMLLCRGEGHSESLFSLFLSLFLSFYLQQSKSALTVM